MKNEERKRKLEKIYVDAAVQSWAMLCPRGMGSLSIRFYEALCLGRIPVHISDEYTFPLSDRIDYSRFCIDIRQDDVPVLGKLLLAWLPKLRPGGIALGFCDCSRAGLQGYAAAKRFEQSNGMPVQLVEGHALYHFRKPA